MLRVRSGSVLAKSMDALGELDVSDLHPAAQIQQVAELMGAVVWTVFDADIK